MSTNLPRIPLSNPDHPAWDFGRYVVLMAAATIILWANASDFDVTEFKSLGQIALVMAGWGSFETWRKHQQGNRDD